MAVGRDRPFYSGKRKCHGMDVQVLADPAGRLIWASPALPGARHDMGAARERGSIDELPGGTLRVRVYAGTDPITGRRHDLIEVVPAGPKVWDRAEEVRQRFLAEIKERRNPRTTDADILDSLYAEMRRCRQHCTDRRQVDHRTARDDPRSGLHEVLENARAERTATEEPGHLRLLAMRSRAGDGHSGMDLQTLLRESAS